MERIIYGSAVATFAAAFLCTVSLLGAFCLLVARCALLFTALLVTLSFLVARCTLLSTALCCICLTAGSLAA